MSQIRLQKIVFWAFCCAMGLFCKRLIGPAANIITGWLHVPGGISSSFSLMFLAIAGVLAPHPGCCTMMAAAQSMLALVFGMVGSMGLLSPIGYIIPGIAMDVVFWCSAKLKWNAADALTGANAFGAVIAAFTANLIVFHLRGLLLLCYICVAAVSGMTFGLLGCTLAKRLQLAVRF